MELLYSMLEGSKCCEEKTGSGVLEEGVWLAGNWGVEERLKR